MGRSRGGWSTKIHLVADRRCRPIARIISPGQYGDSPYFRRILERVRIRRRGLGRPRRRPIRVLADKAYSSRANRAYLRRRGIQAVIPIKKDQQANRLNRGRRAGDRPASTPSGTRSAIPPSGASTSSRATARWPFAPTSANASTRAPSTSPRSGSGSVTLSYDPRDTL
ncbi:transposase [Nonomuraea africana]|uniref:transposase n=1 Tax=Nonomuraea africana TaxID=46171 RepID=UPI001CEF1BF5